MNKRIITTFALVLMLIAFSAPALAADSCVYYDAASIKSSLYIDRYTTSISTGSGGDIIVECSVIGTYTMDVIGIESLVIQQYVSGVWISVYTWNDLYEYNSVQASVEATYGGTVGSTYRAKITFYAENSGGSDSRTVTTSSVVAKN